MNPFAIHVNESPGCLQKMNLLSHLLELEKVEFEVTAGKYFYDLSAHFYSVIE
jgi:hypothetical protein